MEALAGAFLYIKINMKWKTIVAIYIEDMKGTIARVCDIIISGSLQAGNKNQRAQNSLRKIKVKGSNYNTLAESRFADENIR